MKILVALSLLVAAVSAEISVSDSITEASAINFTRAQLQIRLRSDDGKMCGGSLISSTWVVSSAHCVDGYSASQFIVYLGSATTIGGGTQRVPTQIVVHNDWNRTSLSNDIALLKIDPVTLSTRIQPVELPANSTYSLAAGSLVTATGWMTSDTSPISSTLQSVNLTVISNTNCANTYGPIFTSSNICVATPSINSTCNGDSGDPVVDASNDVLIGLTSFGSSAACTNSYPASLTSISYFRSWITTNTGI